MNGACSSKKHIGPASGAKGRGQRLLNFNNKDNFKDFLYQTLLVFLQIKDKKKPIPSGIFVLTPGSCPTGGTWVCRGLFLTWSCGISN